MQADSRTASLFAEFLARRDAGEAEPFEAFVARHTDEAEGLRALAAEWAGFEGRYEGLLARPSATERYRELLERLGGRGSAGARFVARGEVGRGGMGRVLRAFDPDLERELALKVARDDDGDDPESRRRRRARFLDEARITARLQHPGIVPVHELGLDAEGRVYYTMPLIEGEDLERVFERVHAGQPGASVARALTHVLRLCEAMAYAHACGVVHGDLKPANVRIGSFGEVYVMDWGLARPVGTPARPERELGADAFDRTASLVSRVLGTPAYLAPEQVLAHAPGPDPRADVYSVGAILYRLLSARLPHEAELGSVRDLEGLRALFARPPIPLARLAPRAAPELVAIAERAMHPDPRQRYPDMGALAEDLRAFLEGRVVRAHAVGPLVELSKWVRRNRATAAALIGLVLTLAAGLAASALLFRRASSERDRVLRLSDVKRLDDLVESAETLWPAVPARLAEFDAWLAQARELTAHLPAHRATLLALRGAARAEPPASAIFDTTEAQWEHDTLAELVADLERFAAPDGLLVRTAARREFAASVAERTLRSAEAARRWEEAVNSIADPRACPAYRGLALAPQLGLVPLGSDPDSSLWEFAHVESGTVPARDAEGRLVLSEESAIVLVLIPGGEFLMGAQAEDPALPGYCAAAFDNEAPPHEVALAPFFLGKHELTQGQWQRAAGSNPSTFAPGSAEAAVTWMHPVETLNRSGALRMMRRLGLDLPTEAQWEYAARAGTSTPWWTGSDPRSLAGAVNLADQAVVRAGGQWPQTETWLDDGYFRHAPVDSLRANPFGLHHVLGNVWEWCRDDFGSYELPVAGDGLRMVTAPSLPVGRGGGYVNNAAFARATLRDSRPDSPHLLFGLRPACALEP